MLFAVMAHRVTPEPAVHAVQFYDNESRLCSTVAEFLREGLEQGHPAIVIATGFHSAKIARELAARHVDVDAVKRVGDLIVLDAEDTLATFMVEDAPDSRLFHRQVNAVLEQTLAGRIRTPVRAYGEMVDLLWRDGRERAATRLEVLWNELATTRTFSLLCGYSMGNFYKQTKQFQDICNQHTHVLGPGCDGPLAF